MHRRALVVLSMFFALMTATASRAEREPSWIANLAPTPPAAAEEAAPMPFRFRSASYEVDVLGTMAVGTLVQEFFNPGETGVEASYASGLPRGLMVDGVELQVGGVPVDTGATSRVGATAHRKAQARIPGLRSERPFAVPAGETVTVRTSFRASLLVQNGLFRLRLPAVRPCEPERDDCDGTAVPASVSVRIHHAEPLRVAESASHALVVDYEGDRTVIELAEGVSNDGRDFQLAFGLGTEDDRPALVSYVGPERDGRRDMMVVLAPSAEPTDEAVRPKQLLVILDTSGSMKPYLKLDKARGALSWCLEKLRPSDHFNIVEFDSEFTMLRPEPAAADLGVLNEAADWLSGLEPEGGTRLLPALAAALAQPDRPELHRMILVLTDGIVTDETQALDLLSKKLGNGRLFVVGIGSDVRTETVIRLAEFGRGTAAFADDPESVQAVMQELFGSISSPIAWDLELDWGGADVEVLGSPRIPDLYAGRPVTVHARVRGEPPVEVSVKGQTMNGEQVFYTAPVPRETELPRMRPRSTATDTKRSASKPAARP